MRSRAVDICRERDKEREREREREMWECIALILFRRLLPAEVFNDKECPDDYIWPCKGPAYIYRET